MKKIILLASFITSLSSFAFGSAVIRGGLVLDYQEKEISDKRMTPYFVVEGEYQLPIIAINDKLIFSIGTGAAANIGGANRDYPMYFDAYVNPTLDYKINEDLILKTGLSFGVGVNLKKDIRDIKAKTSTSSEGETKTNRLKNIEIYKEGIKGPVQPTEEYMRSNFTSPILGTFEVQYKNLSVALKFGTKIDKDKYKDGNVTAEYNGALTLGYSFGL